MKPFICSTTPKLYYGEGVFLSLPDELAGKSFHSIVIITGKYSLVKTGNWKVFTNRLHKLKISFNHFTASGENDPDTIDTIVHELHSKAVDAVVAIGGGTVLDAGKAIAALLCMDGSIADYLEDVGNKTPTGERKPLFCVPTTSGTGSEATKNSVISKIGPSGFKKSLRHENYIPDCVFLDPALTVTCPPETTAASGLDAITQLIEAYVSTGANKYTDPLALEGLKFAGKSFPWAVEEGNDVEARGSMAFAAYLSGIALANAGLGVVHGAASVLGALHHIPHGVVCGTLVGKATERIIEKISSSSGWDNAVLKRYSRAGIALNGRDEGSIEDNCTGLVKRLNRWIEKYEIKRLGDYGFIKEELIKASGNISLKNTPVELTGKEIELLLLARL